MEKQSCLRGGSTFLVPVGIWAVSQDPEGLMWHLGPWDEEGMLSLQTSVLGPLSAQEGRAVVTISSSELREKLPPLGYRFWVYFSSTAHKSWPKLIHPGLCRRHWEHRLLHDFMIQGGICLPLKGSICKQSFKFRV